MSSSKNGSSPYCGCLYYAANALARVITRMAEDAFRPTGLSPSYAFLLLTVIKEPGIQPGALAGILMLSPSTVTRLLEKLDAKGYISRHVEGRCTRIYPTERGSALEAKLRESWRSLFLAYAEMLGEDHAKTLTDKVYQATLALEGKKPSGA